MRNGGGLLRSDHAHRMPWPALHRHAAARRGLGQRTEFRYSSGTEPVIVVPAPGTESQRTVPPIAPSRSAMFV